MGAFEFGNAAATLMILRATELLTPSRGENAAARIALLLYVDATWQERSRICPAST